MPPAPMGWRPETLPLNSGYRNPSTPLTRRSRLERVGQPERPHNPTGHPDASRGANGLALPAPIPRG